jgi:hypothetical protein
MFLMPKTVDEAIEKMKNAEQDEMIALMSNVTLKSVSFP